MTHDLNGQCLIPWNPPHAIGKMACVTGCNRSDCGRYCSEMTCKLDLKLLSQCRSAMLHGSNKDTACDMSGWRCLNYGVSALKALALKLSL
jgi:hypothetical protein